jgi:putative MATE family efflux protein
MKSSYSYHQIWKITFPIILGLLAQSIMITLDTAFLGRVGEVALGASALGGLLYLALVMVGQGFGIGSQIIIGRRNGEKNYRDIGQIADHNTIILMGMSVIMFIVLAFYANSFLRTFIKSEEIFQSTCEFLKYRKWGIFFGFLNIGFSAFYVGTVRTRYISFATLIMAFVNFALDYILIFGYWGFPEMGVAGAGIASSIAEAVATVFYLVVVITKKNRQTYGIFRFHKADWVLTRKIFNISGPIMLQHLISFSSWFIFFIIIEQMGQHDLAVSNIARSIYILLMIPIIGFTQTTGTLVSNLIGGEEHAQVIPLIKKIVTMSFVFTMVMIAANLLIPRSIISVYTSDPNLIKDTVPVLYVICVALVMFSVSLIMFSGVSGTGNTKMTLIIDAVTLVMYLLMAYLLAIVFKTSIAGVWFTEAFYFLCMGIMSFLYLRSGKWKNKKI